MTVFYFLAVAVAIALAQIWTKPKWVPGAFYNSEKLSQWRWTFIVLWVALGVVVTKLLILPLFFHV